ncbi:hypothetical protein B0T20DRAFT_263667 [Sordaria brevicollis]|uniref:Uncharacterized protein n=1 Tax=Sordaria brevicollis TaxID=83679 RepID=A0AAE0PAT8_SORBR|nr:hypothetical protein B0T20DRAFT_263667 [Sordaria brevicollis]
MTPGFASPSFLGIIGCMSYWMVPCVGIDVVGLRSTNSEGASHEAVYLEGLADHEIATVRVCHTVRERRYCNDDVMVECCR